MRTPQRTLKRALELSTGKLITSDDLLVVHPDRYQEIRRAAVAGRREGSAAFACEKCGHGVYAPRSPNTKLPFWRHYTGAPEDCPWWSGTPSTIDQNSARQFQGAQESPLHRWLKHEVGDLLACDPNTRPGSVAVDAYLIADTGKRRPDVRAVHSERQLAVEIQLSTTQLPIIDAREHFYAREGHHLLWVTWNFEPVERSRLLTAFEDIFYSHNQNIFSLDQEVLHRARTEGRFLIRAYWQEGGLWATATFQLNDLTWPDHGLPYAVAPPLPWHEEFLAEWEAGTTIGGTAWDTRKHLFEEIIERLKLPDVSAADLDAAQVTSLINTIRSIISGRPMASRQSTLTEVLNTFLHVPERQPYAQLLVRIVRATGHGDLLLRPSTRGKLGKALECVQAGQRSPVGKIALALFPRVLDHAVQTPEPY